MPVKTKPLVSLEQFRKADDVFLFADPERRAIRRLIQLAFVEGQRSGISEADEVMRKTRGAVNAVRTIAQSLTKEEREALQLLNGREAGDDQPSFKDLQSLVKKELAWFDEGQGTGGMTALGGDVFLLLWEGGGTI